MTEDFRVPVERLRVLVWFAGGQEREVELFCPPDATAQSMLDDERRFLPAMGEHGVCLVGREAIVALRVPHEEQTDEAPDSGIPIVTRKITVTLASGRRVSGDVRIVAADPGVRTADLINDDASYLTLFRPEDVVHIVKDHVSMVEEG